MADLVWNRLKIVSLKAGLREKGAEYARYKK